jgi:hypothetical protein
MTLDERIEFLFKSCESLHASTMELHGITREHTKHIEEHTKQLEIDAENIRGLARIAAIHEKRLTDLEEPPSKN